MGTADHLRYLVGYNRWANDKIEAVARDLSAAELETVISPSYPSIGRTLIHMTGAQTGWLARLSGEPVDRDALIARVQQDPWGVLGESQEGWERFVGGLTDEQAAAEIVFEKPFEGRGILGRLIQHVMNHGSHHRSELALMLSHLSRSPGDLDMVFYEP